MQQASYQDASHFQQMREPILRKKAPSLAATVALGFFCTAHIMVWHLELLTGRTGAHLDAA
jgi:hypothetical protein